MVESTSAYAPGLCGNGAYSIVAVNPDTGKVKSVLPLRQAPSRIIGIRNDSPVYTASPQVDGAKGVALYFCQIGQATDVYSVKIINQVVEEAIQ